MGLSLTLPSPALTGTVKFGLIRSMPGSLVALYPAWDERDRRVPCRLPAFPSGLAFLAGCLQAEPVSWHLVLVPDLTCGRPTAAGSRRRRTVSVPTVRRRVSLVLRSPPTRRYQLPPGRSLAAIRRVPISRSRISRACRCSLDHSSLDRSKLGRFSLGRISPGRISLGRGTLTSSSVRIYRVRIGRPKRSLSGPSLSERALSRIGSSQATTVEGFGRPSCLRLPSVKSGLKRGNLNRRIISRH